jgi:thioredoxin-like negative regulator of GroEL
LTKLYKFYKNDCPPCYSLSRNLIKVSIPDTIELVELNVGEDKNKEFAKEFGIDKVPTLLFENGNKLSGIKTREEIQSFIAENM